MHPCDLPLDDLWKQCRAWHDRRSGPGGQHRNKVETAVIVVHEPTGVRAEASERRSQAANRQAALARLRTNLALNVRQPRGSRSPSELWKSRCRGLRLAVSVDHEDFPTLLAEALDVVAEHDYDMKAAADALGISPSQLIRLLKRDPRGLVQVNQQRAARGLHPFH